MGGRSPAILPAKQRAVKDLLPGEVLEHTFLYLNREDVEALHLSHRYLYDIISAEGFGKLTPLRPLKMVQLLDDEIAIWRNGTAKRFDYDSEDVACWLRNACVDTVDMTAFFVHYNWNAERALRWFIRQHSVFRVINIVVKLPLNDGALLEGFLRPDSSHHWTSVSIGGLRGNLPLTSSSLESVVHLSLLEHPENTV